MSDALRRQLYTLMIVVASGMALGRILSAEELIEPSVYRKRDDPGYMGRKWPNDRPPPMPTFSSNDRSRWSTVRALVDRRHLDRLPARAVQRLDVVVPLLLGQHRLHRDAFEVGDHSLRQTG